MEDITNYRALCVRLVVEYLQRCGLMSGLDKIVDEDGKITKAVVQGAKEVTVLGIEVQPETKCLVSIFTKDQPLGQAIFDYKEDLKMDSLKLPLKLETYLQEKTRLENTLLNIDSKYQFGQDPREKPHSKESAALSSEEVPRLTTTDKNAPPQRPPDMPGFEDEYQIGGISNIRPFPGMNIDPPPHAGYGDRDLYPTGQKFPGLNGNIMGPTTRDIPPPGGMIFDPSLGRRDFEGRHKGPGWMPGAKYDDPYGRPTGPTGSNPFGNGPAGGFGFI